MSGFSKHSTAFLSALARNNNRDWFAQNKARYETTIKGPAKAFSLHMSDRLSDLTGLEYTPKIFRIYRDIRFSKDKTPYRTHQRISFNPKMDAEIPPAWFFSLERDHLVLGAGVFGYQKAMLERWRARVAVEDGIELAEALSDMTAKGVRLSEPELKRVPREYGADHPRADLLRRKGIAAWLDFPNADLAYGEKAVENCAAQFEKLKPVYDWLCDD